MPTINSTKFLSLPQQVAKNKKDIETLQGYIPTPNAYIPNSEKGAPGGVPTLDVDGKIPNDQIRDNPGNYLPLNGTGVMEGSINMDGFDIHTAGSVETGQIATDNITSLSPTIIVDKPLDMTSKKITKVAKGSSVDDVATIDNISDHNTSSFAHADIRTLIGALQGMFIYRGTINLNTVDVTQSALNTRILAIMGRSAQLGDVLVDLDQNEWYFNGTGWANLGIAIIAMASALNDGLMSKEDFIKLNDLYTRAALDARLNGIDVNIATLQTSVLQIPNKAEIMLNIPIAELNNKTLKEVFTDANMIVDPYFDNPSSGFWPVGSANNGVISGGTLTIDATSGSESKFQTKQNFGLVNANNYYVNIDIIQYIYAANTGFKIGASTNVSTIPQGSIGLYSEQGNIPYPNSGDVFADYFQLRVQNTAKLVISHLFLINKTALGIAAVTKARMDYWFSIFYKYRNKQDILVLEQSKVNKFLDQPILDLNGYTLSQVFGEGNLIANQDPQTWTIGNGTDITWSTVGDFKRALFAPRASVYYPVFGSDFKYPVNNGAKLYVATNTNRNSGLDTLYRFRLSFGGTVDATNTLASGIRSLFVTTSIASINHFQWAFTVEALQSFYFEQAYLYIIDLVRFGLQNVAIETLNFYKEVYINLIKQNEASVVLNAINKKADKVQEDWITPTLVNGAVADATNPVQYMKDSMGFVHFRGKFTRNNLGVSQFSMPVGYRASKGSNRFPVVGGNAFAFVEILANGNAMYADYPTTNPLLLDLSNITFKAEA